MGKAKVKKIIQSENTQIVINQSFTIREPYLYLLTALLAFLYFAYAQIADGFYQQDEAAHFINMREFWYEPQRILGNWSKTGYKLVYALPSLLGIGFVTFFNSFLGALTCLGAYRLAQSLRSEIPLLAFVLMATQPLWVNLVFRNYSEILTAFLLVWGAWAHYSKRFVLAALAMSYVAFVRQEFYPFVGLYFIYLAYHKKWLPSLLLGLFPLFQHTWGMILTGDPLYLLHQITGMSAQIAEAYPRQGFEHYFLMSPTIFGGVALTFFIAYLVINIQQKQLWAWEIAFLVLGYLFLQSLFNAQSLKIGPATGGNLRYLIVIAPLLSVLALQAIEQFSILKTKIPLLVTLIVWVLLVNIFMTYQTNLVTLRPDMGRDWRPLYAVVLAAVALFLPILQRQKIWTILAILVFMTAVSLRPIKRSDEDKACETFARWYETYEKENGQKQIFWHHTMFYYFLGRTSFDFERKPLPITEKNLADAPEGSLIIWDSHYSHRPELRKESLPHVYFLSKPEEYKLIHSQEVKNEDGEWVFLVLVFEKLKKS